MFQELKMIGYVSGPPDPPVNCTVGEPDPFKVKRLKSSRETLLDRFSRMCQ